MGKPHLASVVHTLRTLADARERAEESDGQLLERFARSHDEGAFAALLRRHGPLVHGVCRRVLAQAQDAEDAFQATFLVLARKAGSIRKRQSVGSWLYGVAYKIAARLRSQNARRREQERKAAMRKVDRRLGEAWREIGPVLDEEIALLPDRYRQALVLCYLEGKTQDEAARELGCPLGTVRSRLGRARQRLQAALTRRGLALSAGGLAALLTAGSAAGSVPVRLLRSTIQAAVRCAASRSADGIVSVQVAALVKEGLPSLIGGRLRVVLLALCVGLGAGGAGLLARHAEAEQQPAVQEAKRANAEAEGKEPAKPARPRTDVYGDPLPEGAVARIGTTRLRANQYINVVAFSPDGHRLAFADESGLVRVCEAADGEPVLDFKPEDRFSPITELAFSPDGRTLAVSGHWCKAVWLFDLATRKVRQTILSPTATQARRSRQYQGPGFAFTPDGRVLVGGGKDCALRLWDTATGTEQASLSATNEPAWSVTLTADGQTALTAHDSGELHLWDVRNRKHLRKLAATAKHPQFTALAPDGKTIALASGDTELELWDPDGGRRHQLRTTATIVGLGFAPDGASVYLADGKGTITTWGARTGAKRKSLTCDGILLKYSDGEMPPKPSAWFRPDGKAMAWANFVAIRPWDLITGQETPQMTMYRHGVRWAGFSADGRVLSVGGARGEVGVWDAATGRPLGPPRQTDLTGSASFAPAADRGKVVAVIWDKQYAKSRHEDAGPIFLWDPAGNAGPVRLREQAGPAWHAALSPDNRFVVATEDPGKIRVYDAPTGKLIRSFAGRKYEYHPTFSPDGALLATTGSDRSVRLYDVATGRLVRESECLSPPGCVAFSPDGRLLACGDVTFPLRKEQSQQPGALIYLWDTATGQELRRMATGHHDVQAVSFSPDGRLIASGGFDKVVRLWEAVSGQERRRYEGHGHYVQSVDFAPDGRRLASASVDGTALVWHVFDPAPAERSATDLDALWADLAKDGITAHRAIAAMIAAKGTAAFLTARVKPAVNPSDAEVKKWLADLGSPEFATREAAQKEIARVAEQVEPALRRAREAATDLEVRRRLTTLLDSVPLQETRPEPLRDLRAVEVLGHLDSDAARRLLGELAKGGPEARLTQEAQAALDRLAKRTPR